MRGILVGLALLLLWAPAGAAAQVFAPLDAPGPALSVSDADLAKRFACSPGGLAGAKVAPVMLLQGTGATAKDNWSWTYEPALTKLGIPWCHVDLPDNATGDIQRAGEYVVAALRVMRAGAQRKVSIVGHSQGGMVGRWALRFWPDTRGMVEDVVGFAPSNHGTTEASCSTAEPCSAAGWQQADEANFIKALNSRAETFPGISYTNIVTRIDEVVKPVESSFLSPAGGGRVTNVATQDLCPTAAYEHLLIGLIDPVAYALAIDALSHDGPADPTRVDPLVCAQVLHPGINPVTAPIDGASAAASFGSYEAATVPAEPALACYTTASCPPGATTSGGIVPARLAKTGCSKRKLFTVTFTAIRARGATATVSGKRVKVRAVRGGRVSVRVDLRGHGRSTVTLRLRGRDRRGRKVTVVRLYHAC
jgi:pimeloyl-ACP methyl ester carboxylesterase